MLDKTVPTRPETAVVAVEVAVATLVDKVAPHLVVTKVVMQAITDQVKGILLPIQVAELQEELIINIGAAQAKVGQATGGLVLLVMPCLNLMFRVYMCIIVVRLLQLMKSISRPMDNGIQ